MLRIVHDTDQASQEVAPLDLDELCHIAAREMIALALEAERRAYLEAHADELDATGHRLVVSNGRARPREVMTGAGMVPVTAPRSMTDDRASISAPRSCRPMHGVARRCPRSCPSSTCAASAPGTSRRPWPTSSAPTRVCRPRRSAASRSPGRRSTSAGWAVTLSAVDYVYWWVDGLHFRIRLEEDRLCCLVIVGVRPDGSKELVALADGYRESTESWAELLRDLKARGLAAPVLAVGDGALGFWAALRDVFPTTAEQRCWVHKTARTLDALPKRKHEEAKAALVAIYTAATRSEALDAVTRFGEAFAEWPKAVAKVTDELDVLLAFLDYPAEHHVHLRTSNPIESTFFTVRLRTRVTKGPDRGRPVSPWPTSSCARPRNAGAGSTHRTSSRSCEPGPCSSTVSYRKGACQPPKRSPSAGRTPPPDPTSSTTLDNCSAQAPRVSDDESQVAGLNRPRLPSRQTRTRRRGAAGSRQDDDPPELTGGSSLLAAAGSAAAEEEGQPICMMPGAAERLHH